MSSTQANHVLKNQTSVGRASKPNRVCLPAQDKKMIFYFGQKTGRFFVETVKNFFLQSIYQSDSNQHIHMAFSHHKILI